MQKESSNTKTDDNFRLPKNLLMIIAIVIIGVAAGFTIASTHNTCSTQANAMAGQERPQRPERPDLDYESEETEESLKEESVEGSEIESEESTDEIGRLPHQDQQPYAPGQAPAPGSNDQTTQIILFSVEAIAAALLIIYLIMSGFNKKNFKETLSSSDKAIVFILGSFVLAAAFIGGDILIANAINGKPSQSQQGPQMQMPGQQKHPQMRIQRGEQRPTKTDRN